MIVIVVTSVRYATIKGSLICTKILLIVDLFFNAPTTHVLSIE